MSQLSLFVAGNIFLACTRPTMISGLKIASTYIFAPMPLPFGSIPYQEILPGHVPSTRAEKMSLFTNQVIREMG
jgi:hypothetical protein